MSDEDGGREVEGHARQEEQGFHPNSSAHACHGHHAAFRQGCGQGVEHHVCGMPDDLGKSGRPGHPVQIGPGPFHPSPGGEALLPEQAEAFEHDEVEDGSGQDGTERGPGKPFVAEFGKAEHPQAQAQVPQGVHRGHQNHGVEGTEHFLLGPKNGIADDKEVVGRGQVHEHFEHVPHDGHQVGRDLQQGVKGFPEHENRDEDDQSRDKSYMQAEPHVSLDTAAQPGPRGLTDGRNSPVGNGQGHHQKEKQRLRDHAHTGLDFPSELSGNPDIHESDEEVEEHHHQLRPGQTPDGFVRRAAQGCSCIYRCGHEYSLSSRTRRVGVTRQVHNRR